jgi:MFS family permease
MLDSWQLFAMATPSTNALTYRPYVFYLAALACVNFAVQIMSVAVGWQVYELTHDPYYLGIVGLVQFLPALVLVLVTGLVADRFNRRVILGLCLVAEVIAAGCLLAFTIAKPDFIWPVFVILVGLGVARAFFNPAGDALAPNLLSKEAIPHGISLGSMTWQTASIVGPVLGGLLYGFSAELAYSVATALLALAALCVIFIGTVPQDNHVEETSIHTLLAGFKFIKSEQIVLGAISLDLFAVLLGGTMALLPVYASDILHAGPVGLGLLRSSIGIGSIVVALWLMKYGIKDHAGIKMFMCVAGFGAAVVLFGFSTWIPLSIFALMLMGAFDMVSVYIRETLMQLRTPDEVRGRVNAVNRVFIGASNELGEFRAGMVAWKLGAVTAVVMGGVGTMAVAAIWSQLFPKLREARKLAAKD